MNKRDLTQTTRSAEKVFSDPVAYLAEFGIDAVLVSKEELPLAA